MRECDKCLAQVIRAFDVVIVHLIAATAIIIMHCLLYIFLQSRPKPINTPDDLEWTRDILPNRMAQSGCEIPFKVCIIFRPNVRQNMRHYGAHY